MFDVIETMFNLQKEEKQEDNNENSEKNIELKEEDINRIVEGVIKKLNSNDEKGGNVESSSENDNENKDENQNNESEEK